MTYHLRANIALFFLISIPCVAKNRFEGEPRIRVRLCKLLSASKGSFRICSPGGITIARDVKNKTLNLQEEQLRIQVKQDLFYITTKQRRYIFRTPQLHLLPHKQRFMINGNIFSGMLRVHASSDQAGPTLVNVLPIEDYLYAVLPFEIYQFWPHEMQKVQAIASRTYAIYHLLHARKHNMLFDVKSTNFHQTYNGHHRHHHIREAITQTYGQTLCYDDKPALTMFDACCGGIIPAQVNSPHFLIAPFLARKARCTYCKDCSLYSWSRSIPLREALQNLATLPLLEHEKMVNGPYHNISISKKDRAGKVEQIALHGRKGTSAITAAHFMRALDCKIWSDQFVLATGKQNGNGYCKIRGKGFGHQLGLCQHGAHTLVKQGWPCEKILAFYYPGCTLKKLYS